MQRRVFCKLLTSAAVSKVIPSFGQTQKASQPDLPTGFNHYSQDYAHFCTASPGKRVFYQVSHGKIVEAMLDELSWKPTEWGKPPQAAHIGRVMGRRADAVADPESCRTRPIRANVGFLAAVRRS